MTGKLPVGVTDHMASTPKIEQAAQVDGTR